MKTYRRLASIEKELDSIAVEFRDRRQTLCHVGQVDRIKRKLRFFNKRYKSTDATAEFSVYFTMKTALCPWIVGLRPDTKYMRMNGDHIYYDTADTITEVKLSINPREGIYTIDVVNK